MTNLRLYCYLEFLSSNEIQAAREIKRSDSIMLSMVSTKVIYNHEN